MTQTHVTQFCCQIMLSGLYRPCQSWNKHTPGPVLPEASKPPEGAVEAGAATVVENRSPVASSRSFWAVVGAGAGAGTREVGAKAGAREGASPGANDGLRPRREGWDWTM